LEFLSLKYFDSGAEVKGGCNHEFVKGHWDGKTFWSDYSLILDDDILNNLGVAELLYSVNPNYDPYGPTEFTVEQWNAVRKKSAEIGGELELLIKELYDWLGDSSDAGIAFTSLGV